jgi:hypothetical protein
MFAARQLIWGRTKQMGNTLKNKRMSARRAAAFLAALGVLVMSSGIALMVTATPANAANDGTLKDWVCKYVGKPGEEVLKSGNDGLVWVDTSATEGTFFTDNQQLSYVLKADVPQDPKPDSSNCPPAHPTQEPTQVAAGVDFVDPTCANGNTASATPVATTGVSYALTSGSVAPGEHVVYTATATSDAFTLTNGPTFEHTFAPAVTNCGSTVVLPPTPQCVTNCGGNTIVSPPAVDNVTKAKTKTHAAAVTPTVVHAGLGSLSTDDVRGEQGLALMLAGMGMLFGAGGLGLRIRVRASRI